MTKPDYYALYLHQKTLTEREQSRADSLNEISLQLSKDNDRMLGFLRQLYEMRHSFDLPASVQAQLSSMVKK